MFHQNINNSLFICKTKLMEKCIWKIYRKWSDIVRDSTESTSPIYNGIVILLGKESQFNWVGSHIVSVWF